MAQQSTPTLGKLMIVGVCVIVAVAALRWGTSGPTGTPEAFAANLTLADATARAEGSGRPVFVYATADWCPPCQHFKKNTLTDPRVLAHLRDRTEPVYLDIDREPALARELGVQAVPTLMAVRGDRMVRATGAMSADAFIAWLENAERELAGPVVAPSVPAGGA